MVRILNVVKAEGIREKQSFYSMIFTTTSLPGDFGGSKSDYVEILMVFLVFVKPTIN